MATTTEPELLYVNSKITDKTNLSPDVFAKWYNDIHIPDIFATSGIDKAYRYITAASDVNAVERPYLALYPIKFEGYLQSAEFRGIPVKSEVLPGPTHTVFDVADFDIQSYSLDVASRPFEGPYLLAVHVENSVNGTWLEQAAQSSTQSAALYTRYSVRQGHGTPQENELGVPPAKLALVWHKTREELDASTEKSAAIGKVSQFRLLKAFSADQPR